MSDPLAGVSVSHVVREETTLFYLLAQLHGRGDYAHGRAMRFGQLAPGSPIAPPGGRLIRSFTREDGAREEVHQGDGWLLYAAWFPDSRYRDSGAHVVAVTEEIAAQVIDATRAALRLRPDDPARPRVRFCWRGHGMPARSRQAIAAPAWADIAPNYPGAARPALARLASLAPASIKGRIILLHGAPGTGKTTFLRCLAREWRGWCDVHVIMDPEKLLGDAAYLMDLLPDTGESDRWPLIILEDCGELIGGEAKRETGQALSRLLNVADGIAGQGMNLLFALTTNEDLTRFHPALTRPGRCLAQVEIPAMPHAEAARWLGRPVQPREHTLAELITLRDGGDLPGEVSTPPMVGQYM